MNVIEIISVFSISACVSMLIYTYFSSYDKEITLTLEKILKLAKEGKEVIFGLQSVTFPAMEEELRQMDLRVEKLKKEVAALQAELKYTQQKCLKHGDSTCHAEANAERRQGGNGNTA